MNRLPRPFSLMQNHSRTALATVTIAALLTGCASGPPPRDWQINARDAMEQTLETWLAGNDRIADAEFAHARDAIASTGRLDLLARLVLARCAAQVASLSNPPNAPDQVCTEFAALAEDARPEEKTYFEFLAGRWQGLNPALLPAQHRAVLSSPGDVKQLEKVTPPLARLVACAILLQRGQLPPEGIALAVDTASAEGWRRPLLAWLGVQLQRAEATGNTALAAQAKKRIALVGGNGVSIRP